MLIRGAGTYQLGIICSALKKPLYVAAESYKFARLYPLNQQDLPASVLQNNPGQLILHESTDVLTTNVYSDVAGWQLPQGFYESGRCFVLDIYASLGTTVCAPRCDYTPAEYISLLFTDIGVLTPAAVSDELIKLYQ